MDTNNTRPIFPWYKERLQTKYLKGQANKISMVGSCLRFANVSLDDFNDCSSILSGDRKGVSPVIFHDSPNHNSWQKPRKCISKEQVCFSKQMIQKQIRREYVAAVEEKLKEHPLAMFPHYQDHMTPELFDKVVSVLDPDMSVNSASALPTPTGDHAEDYEDEENCTEPRKEDLDRAKQGTSANKISSDVQNPSPRNPYVLHMNKNGTKKGRTVKVNKLSTHEDMKSAAKLFSRWFASPDEDTNVTDAALVGSFDGGLQDSSSPTVSQGKNEILSQPQTGRTDYVSKPSETNKVQEEKGSQIAAD
ncbi:protein FAM47E isoform X1 [Epinephelus lanceolatus]